MELTRKLNELLSDYQVFKMNAHGYHWNVKGDLFFEMHQKYKELYDFSSEAIDSIAERIRGLDKYPLHSFKEYLDFSKIQPRVMMVDPNSINRVILDDLTYLNKSQNKIMSESMKSGDFVTFGIVKDISEQTELLSWMYKSFLSQ